MKTQAQKKDLLSKETIVAFQHLFNEYRSIAATGTPSDKHKMLDTMQAAEQAALHKVLRDLVKGGAIQ